MSLFHLTQFFSQRDIDYVQDETSVVFKVFGGESHCQYEIMCTDAPHDWIHVCVWTDRIGAQKVYKLKELVREIDDHFGHRVHIAFVSGSFGIHTYIRPDRIQLEMDDFVYACDKLVLMLTNMTVWDGIAIWDDRLIAAALVDTEGEA
jgi:hypothetical protein